MLRVNIYLNISQMVKSNQLISKLVYKILKSYNKFMVRRLINLNSQT